MQEPPSMSLLEICDYLEEKYGDEYFRYDFRQLALRHPKDRILQFFYHRLISFPVWESKRLMYDTLDIIGKSMFIMITEKYGAGWKLHELLDAHQDNDELVYQFNGYLDYLERVWEFYTYLESNGYPYSEL